MLIKCPGTHHFDKLELSQRVNYLFHKSLPIDKILYRFELKAFADNKINVTGKLTFV